MKGLRVIVALVALSALPFVAVSAQGRSEDNKCKDQVAARGESSASGRSAAPGQVKKCPTAPPPAPPPPPPPSPPPTGVNKAMGVVYEDVDGSGTRDIFAGEMGLAGWTVQLSWNGQLVTSTTSDADGNFVFSGLGNSTYSVCVLPQGGYNQTQPVSGTGCGGAGYSFTLASTFETWAMNNDFGMMLQ